VERRQVLLQQPIKALGIHATRVALHPEVSIEVRVNVAQSEDEAKVQAESGKVVPAAAEEPVAEAAPDEGDAQQAEAADTDADADAGAGKKGKKSKKAAAEEG
jgi:large subunit ribosomal protein L9